MTFQRLQATRQQRLNESLDGGVRFTRLYRPFHVLEHPFQDYYLRVNVMEDRQLRRYAPFDAVALTPFYTPEVCLLYTSPSPRDRTRSRMPSSA